MKVFILGGTASSDRTEPATLQSFSHELGATLGETSHRIMLCSCHPGSADRGVLEGLQTTVGRSAAGKLIVHRPEDNELRAAWQEIESNLALVATEFHTHRGPDFRRHGTSEIDKDALSLSYLLCQISAIRDCDLVLTVGGRADGSASLALAIARDEQSLILPYRFLGGAAEDAFLRLEDRLKGRLNSNEIDALSDPHIGARVAGTLIDKLGRARPAAAPRVFLSYPWKRSDYADLVEAVLRRFDQLTVFRDERDIRKGESISERVEQEIRDNCDIFIALWCREYVESPFCHDEMRLWLDAHRGENLFLLRFDDTRPVWHWLRATETDRETFRANWPVVGAERIHVESAIRAILDDNAERMLGRGGKH